MLPIVGSTAEVEKSSAQAKEIEHIQKWASKYIKQSCNTKNSYKLTFMKKNIENKPQEIEEHIEVAMSL